MYIPALHIKRVFCLAAVCCLLLEPIDLQAQSSLQPTASMNYVLISSPREAVEDLQSLPPERRGAVIKYYDGLGREIQNIAIMQSPAQGNLVQPVVYDELGRIPREFLPFEHKSATPAAYFPGWEEVQQGFFKSLSPSDESKHAFTHTEFDNSPLNRVRSTMGPGKSWQEAGKKSTVSYLTNSAGEVRIFRVSADGTLSSPSAYNPGTLYLTAQTDEDGRVKKEWKDLQGRVVQVQTGDSLLTATTRYVYDDFGNLRWVIPPGAADDAGDGFAFSPSDPVAREVCYYYRYDGRKRMIEKHLPGAEPVYMVYDTRDRLVMTQDGNQRASSQWIINQYDVFGRILYTAMISSSHDREHFQSLFRGKQDDLVYALVGEEDKLLVNWWDSYPQGEEWEEFSFRSPGVDWEHYPTEPSSRTRGMLTANKIRIVGAGEQKGEFLRTVNYYDHKTRLIQSVSQTDERGSLAQTFMHLNWAGEVLNDRSEHLFLRDWAEPLLTVLSNQYQYDHAGRLVSGSSTLETGGEPVSFSFETEYDALGRQKNTLLDGLVNSEYDYNIRSWVTGMKHSRPQQSLFELELLYENHPLHPQYSGNISGMNWSSVQFEEPVSYDFTYDGLSRLKTSDFSPEARYSTSYDYDIRGNILNLNRSGRLAGGGFGRIDSLVYDYNYSGIQGNKLMGVLNRVEQPTAGVSFENQGISGFGIPIYEYDSNGNMKRDHRTGRTVEYNFLNLPARIVNEQNQEILYLYTSGGQKIMQQVWDDGNMGETRRYAGAFIYLNDELAWVNTANGRFVPTETEEFAHETHLRDHLGNTRVVLTQEGEDFKILQDNNYYPFGMSIKTMTYTSLTPGPFGQNRYMYNGKEFQPEFGLDWLDYGARFYDPQIGRWHVIDPLVERNHFDYTPFAYVYNNPMRLIDPFGLDTTIYIFDQGERPKDNGIKGKTYTAELIFDFNGTASESYRASSYPNSKSNQDNSTQYNTISSKEFSFDNKFGHKQSSQRGLNIYDNEGSRSASGKKPDGSDAKMHGVNAHSGYSDNGGATSRGSHGCVTWHPDDDQSILNHFDWSGTVSRTTSFGETRTYTGTTGNSSGKIVVFRGDKYSNFKYNELKANQNEAEYDISSDTYRRIN
jgi:RHS repeat-associated protein